MEAQMVPYALETIIGHYYKDGKLLYWCKWLHWPVAASTGITEGELKRTAMKLLVTYHRALGVNGLKPRAKVAKLKETAWNKPPKVKNLKLVEVVSHTTSEEGHVLFTTRWSNHELVSDRPKSAFEEKRDKKILWRYIERHLSDSPITIGTTRKSEENKKIAEVSSARGRPPKTRRSRSIGLNGTTAGTPVAVPVAKVTRKIKSVPAYKTETTPIVAGGTTRKRAATAQPERTPAVAHGTPAAHVAGSAPVGHIAFYKDGQGRKLAIIERTDGKCERKDVNVAFMAHPKEVFVALMDNVFKTM